MSAEETMSGAKRADRVPIPWSLFMVSCLLAFLAGCAQFQAREDIPLKRATVEELMTLLQEREAAIRTMKGLFSATVRGGLLPVSQRMQGTVYFRNPDVIRLRGFSTVGTELFEYMQVDTQYLLRLPTMGRVLSGNPNRAPEMEELARPFELSAWAMQGMLGRTGITSQERVLLDEVGDRYRLSVFGRKGTAPLDGVTRRIWFDRRTLLVVQEDRLSDLGELDATIRFEDFRPLAGTESSATDSPGTGGRGDSLVRPFKILLEDGRGQGSVQVTFHELVPNIPLNRNELGV